MVAGILIGIIYNISITYISIIMEYSFLRRKIYRALEKWDFVSYLLGCRISKIIRE